MLCELYCPDQAIELGAWHAPWWANRNRVSETLLMPCLRPFHNCMEIIRHDVAWPDCCYWLLQADEFPNGCNKSKWNWKLESWPSDSTELEALRGPKYFKVIQSVFFNNRKDLRNRSGISGLPDWFVHFYQNATYPRYKKKMVEEWWWMDMPAKLRPLMRKRVLGLHDQWPVML